MAGFLALGDDKYLGTYINDEEDGVENGTFVVIDYENKKAKLANATTGDGDVYFVENENTNIEEYGIDDIDFRVKKGEFLRLYKPKQGHILVTTNFDESLKQGDEVAVGDEGKAVPIGGRSPKVKFVVHEKTFAYGADAVSLLVLQG